MPLLLQQQVNKAGGGKEQKHQHQYNGKNLEGPGAVLGSGKAVKERLRWFVHAGLRGWSGTNLILRRHKY